MRKQVMGETAWRGVARTMGHGAVLSLALFAASCSGGGGSPSPSPTPSPTPQSAYSSREDAARFLTQATFGPSADDIETALSSNPDAWLRAQLSAQPTVHMAETVEFIETFTSEDTEEWIEAQYPSARQWTAMIGAPDQLRQRMAYALSQIMVVSARTDSENFYDPIGMTYYMDKLVEGAFGNYRDLMEEVTYSAVMARFLTYLQNEKENPETGQVPDENYARELLQLFTIGLYELNMDGSLRTNNGQPIETYTNDDIRGLAKVFTGLSHDVERFRSWDGILTPESRQTRLKMFEDYHSTSEKAFLGTVIPANTPGEQSIDLALDAIFEHPNVAPFVSQQLIQRFVTSNPSAGYVERVATAFENGSFTLVDGSTVGEGRRGDLAATISAILMDQEARNGSASNDDSFGKVREPVLRFAHWARAFEPPEVNVLTEGMLFDTSTSEALNQHPFRAPSVFNFYRPGYVAPSSSSGSAGLVAPELSLVNEITYVSYVNFMSVFIRDQSWVWLDGEDTSFRPDYDDEIAIADEPQALVSQLELALLPSGLQSDTEARIIATLNEIPIRLAADNPDYEDAAAVEEYDRRTRVEVAILMMMTAPEYIVQR